jgi:predicted MFS family arabinose efflux permease
MHWRRSSWALIAWTALMALWLPTSVPETNRANRYAELAVLAVLATWPVVALPLGACCYTRR